MKVEIGNKVMVKAIFMENRWFDLLSVVKKLSRHLALCVRFAWLQPCCYLIVLSHWLGAQKTRTYKKWTPHDILRAHLGTREKNLDAMMICVQMGLHSHKIAWYASISWWTILILNKNEFEKERQIRVAQAHIHKRNTGLWQCTAFDLHATLMLLVSIHVLSNISLRFLYEWRNWVTLHIAQILQVQEASNSRGSSTCSYWYVKHSAFLQTDRYVRLPIFFSNIIYTYILIIWSAK